MPWDNRISICYFPKNESPPTISIRKSLQGVLHQQAKNDGDEFFYGLPDQGNAMQLYLLGNPQPTLLHPPLIPLGLLIFAVHSPLTYLPSPKLNTSYPPSKNIAFLCISLTTPAKLNFLSPKGVKCSNLSSTEGEVIPLSSVS